MPGDPVDFLISQVSDPSTGWSLGTYGAIAVFTRDRSEAVELSVDRLPLSAVTPRGAIRIERTEGVRPLASESATPESWNHRVALCLPLDECAASGRTVLTELGADQEAIRIEDLQSVLFDLGLGALQADLCVRVADPNVVSRLKAHVGRPVFEPGNPARGIILGASPHRVFMSRLGRIEVYQPIPAPNGGGPEGPRTHMLPKLLRLQRTHATTEPIPQGWSPCAHLYPAHPARDEHGRARPFALGAHVAFQDMLDVFGDDALLALKRRVRDAVVSGHSPHSIAVAKHRHAGLVVRIALRQMRATNHDAALLAPWLAVHDRVREAETAGEALHAR